ncbi:putative 26S proteasome regulatory subunit RPN12 [Cryptosporidium felis]|nr:putative 26S proteasome regulatory subunit RPN12 [Cryptosporidium felis]
MAKSAVDSSKLLNLLQQFAKGSAGNLNTLSTLIKQMKILLIDLPTSSLSSKEIEVTEAAIARDVLELSLLVCIMKEDSVGFERDFLNLQRYYFDFETTLAKSKNQDMIKGLYLLFLLSRDRIGDFHVFLETISEKDQDNTFISCAKDLELYLLDGNYSKIMQMQSSLPTPNYQAFFNQLVNTCREKVAKCIECSYNKIGIGKLKNMMRFSNDQELISFINKISPSSMEDSRSQSIQWKLIDNAVYFERKDPLPTSNLDLISNALGYAIELERIV